MISDGWFCFSPEILQFCEKIMLMKKISFEAICEQIIRCYNRGGAVTDLETLCRQSGVGYRMLNNKFYETFGMSGDDVIAGIYSSYA